MDFEFIYDAFRPSVSVDDEPSVVLTAWRVKRLTNGEEILVGIRPEAGTWRMSTPIVEFLPLRRLVITTSGRHYLLDGPPAIPGNVVLETTEAEDSHKQSTAADVSRGFWTAIQDAAGSRLQ